MSKYHKKYQFRVEIDGIEKASFQACGGLKANISIIEQNEGGALAPTKELGRVTYDNLILKNGVSDNQDLWLWMKTAIDGDDFGAEKDLSIVQTNRAGTEIKRWDVFGALPIGFLAGDWDADSEENIVEELELSIQEFDRG